VYDVLVVGSGFSGSIIARKLAEENNLKILLLEQRSHIGGNMYDEINEYGVLVQKYGPHSLTTNKPWIVEYLKQYSEWFEHDIKANSFLDGKYIRLPFNFQTVKQLLPINEANDVICRLREEFHGRDRISIFEMVECGEKIISNFGSMLFDKAYKPYVMKQWGLKTNEIDRSVLNRVQMALSYDERYINKDFQYMPKDGFTKVFKNILDHCNIDVKLNCDAIKGIFFDSSKIKYDDKQFKAIVFTGAIDELFSEKYGKLPYRSLDIKYHTEQCDYLLPTDIVSFPDSGDFTRKSEYKRFNGQKSIEFSTISIEYPLEYSKNENLPYYPIINNENVSIYNKYLKESLKYENLFLCGRLAEYKYYNMDSVIERAFIVYDDIIKYIKKN